MRNVLEHHIHYLERKLEQQHAELAIFNHPLSPTQQRNLERHLDRHVMDRTGLILDIFSQRAQSHIGKTQVELAQVRYRMSRLVRAWSHLERQRGGIGVRGGPGETQIELDRRMLATKAKRLENELEKLQRQQRTQRRARHRKDVFSVSLVGYTNAGKSTLLNALAGGEQGLQQGGLTGRAGVPLAAAEPRARRDAARALAGGLVDTVVDATPEALASGRQIVTFPEATFTRAAGIQIGRASCRERV